MNKGIWVGLVAITFVAGSLMTGAAVFADDDDDDENEIVITGTAGNDNIRIDEISGRILCFPANCTIDGPVTATSPGFWTINSGSGDGVDEEYKVDGNGGQDTVAITEGTTTDEDKFDVSGNTIQVSIRDGAGDDEYEINGAGGRDSVSYTDGPGNDKVDFEANGDFDSMFVNDRGFGFRGQGSGDDEYKGESIERFSFVDNSRTENDKIEIN